MKLRNKNRIISMLVAILILCSYLNIPQIEVHATETTTEVTTEETTTESTSSSSSGKMYDGKPLDNPVCDSGFENSFDGGEYYDMAVPYSLTNEDVGGYANGGGDGLAMADSDKKYAVGDRWNVDQSITGSANYLYSNKKCSNLTFSTNDDGMGVATDTNGTEYYCLALPKYFFNNGSVEWGTGNRGVCCELYFTDGKYIRVLIADAKAVGHTNGGEGSNHEGTRQDSGHYYTFSTLNYEQYQNIYQAYAGEVFEWFATTSHANVPAIAGSSGHVAYVRVYTNVNLYTGVPTLASGVSKSAVGTRTNKGCNITGTSDGTDSQSTANATTGYVGGYYKEMDLEAYNKLCEVNIQAEYLDSATRNNLSGDDLSAVTDWKGNTDAMQEENDTVKVLRKFVQLLAILLSIYSILLYIAYWFDRLNNFIDIDFVSIMTFGRFMISESEDECTYKMKNLGDGKKKTVNHRAILTICLLAIAFAVLIMTGVLYKLVAKIVYFFINLFGG